MIRARSLIPVILLALVAAACSNGVDSQESAPSVEVLARGAFPDAVTAQITVPVGGEDLNIDVDDPSEALFAEITFGPQATTGWHTHPGPAIVTVASGEFTLTNAADCQSRVYDEGESFVDPGHGNVHRGTNESETDDAVVYVAFLEVPEGSGPTIPVDDPGCE